MDDNKVNPQENQPAKTQTNPSFETVEVESPTDIPQETAQGSPPVEEAPPEAVIPEAPATDSEGFQPPPPVYSESKNKLFFIVGGTVVFLLIFIFIIRAVFKGKSAPKSVSLVYWGLWEEKEAIQPLIEAYQQKNPQVKINYQKMSEQNYREKLIARSKSKSTDGEAVVDRPDIFRFHNTWLPEIKDILAPIPENIFSQNEFKKTFYPIHQKDLKVGNYFYGIPLEIDGLVLIYNDGLFKKAGIQTIPVTWDDITEIVPKLTVKDSDGRLVTSGIALGTASNIDHFSDIFGLLLIQNGGSLGNLDQPEAVGALETYRKFAEQPQGYWTDEMPSSVTAFIQEKVAMIIVPSWELLVIKSANPEISLKVVPVPSVPGVENISLAGYWIEGVSRFSENQLEAWKFLRYLSEKDNLTKLYENQSKLRLFGEPYSRVDLAQILSQNQYLGAVIKQANYFESMPLVSRTFDNGLNDEIIKYIENAINSTVQGVSYQEALKTAKKGIDQVYTKYNINTQ